MQSEKLLNIFQKGYVKLIFLIFHFGITAVYGSKNNEESTGKKYQQMIKMKQNVYNIFNFLTKNLKECRNSYLMEIKFKNFRFFIRPLILSDIVMTTEIWEPYVKSVFRTKKNDVIIDVGAHIGTYVILNVNKVGKAGKIIALEPDHINSNILEKNIEINRIKNVILIKKAAGKEIGTVNLSLVSDPMLSKIGNHTVGDNVKVECITLNSLIDELSLEDVHWLKIDAEGYELEVLRGSNIIIEKFHPKIIIETRSENQEKMKKILKYFGYNIKYLAGEYFFAE